MPQAERRAERDEQRQRLRQLVRTSYATTDPSEWPMIARVSSPTRPSTASRACARVASSVR